MRNQFELKPEHLALLSHSYWGWQDCETGAPEMDPKRPYGNSSVALDVREILQESGSVEVRERKPVLCPECDEAMIEGEECKSCGFVDEDGIDEAAEDLMHFHTEMLQVIQVVVCCVCRGEVPKTGVYVNTADRYLRPVWVLK